MWNTMSKIYKCGSKWAKAERNWFPQVKLRHIFYCNGWGSASPDDVGGGIHKGGERVICMAETANQQRIDREKEKEGEWGLELVFVVAAMAAMAAAFENDPPAFHWYCKLTGFCQPRWYSRNEQEIPNKLKNITGGYACWAVFSSIVSFIVLPLICENFTWIQQTSRNKALPHWSVSYPSMPELEKPISSLVDDNELLFVPRIDWVSQSPPVIFIRAESPLHCIHIITCLPVSLSLSLSLSGVSPDAAWFIDCHKIVCAAVIAMTAMRCDQSLEFGCNCPPRYITNRRRKVKLDDFLYHLLTNNGFP